jgi:hypothetical protein
MKYWNSPRMTYCFPDKPSHNAGLYRCVRVCRCRLYAKFKTWMNESSGPCSRYGWCRASRHFLLPNETLILLSYSHPTFSTVQGP